MERETGQIQHRREELSGDSPVSKRTQAECLIPSAAYQRLHCQHCSVYPDPSTASVAT